MPTLGIHDIASSVRERKRSAVEVVRESLDAIRARNPAINALVRVFDDRALDDARRIDARVAAGEGHLFPLAGVPVALKDNIALSWGRTTCASRILERYESPFDATAARKLLDAGAIVVAKSNLDEFAMGASTEHSHFGPTRNPWDPSRVAGGSSGGSAAAVAAGLVPLALGSDTGGSVRQPAGHCGIVGLKPTYGRISRYGLVAYASSLDQIGPMTTSVRDAALALQVLAGHDPLDATSTTLRVPNHTAQLDEPIENLSLGVPRQATTDANHPETARLLDETIERFESLGARVRTIDLPMTDAAVAAYYIIATAEASSNLARYDGVRYGRRADLAPDDSLEDLYCRSRSEGFGDEVKRRIMLGTHVLSSGYYDAYYLTALKARRRILNDFQDAFAHGCHAILMPASPAPAFPIGAKRDDPLALYTEDVYTVGVNLAGLPAITVPVGLADVTGAPRGLPVGVQIISPAFDEPTMLRVARMLEHARGPFPAPPRGT